MDMKSSVSHAGNFLGFYVLPAYFSLSFSRTHTNSLTHSLTHTSVNSDSDLLMIGFICNKI